MFPTDLDTFTNPTSTDKLNSGTVPHALQHANTNDAVEALQVKVGIDDSADTNSLDYKVANPDLSACWPVGSVFISVVDTSPATLLGFGTWSAIGAGRVLVGQDTGDADFDTIEETGGAKTVTLTAAQSGLPQHTHTQNAHTHTQDAHTHTQNSHNHTQDSHNHTQNSFAPRIINSGTAGTVGVQGASAASNANASNAATTATNQAATATNQAATAVNQNATATNQNATATNQNTGPTDAAQAHANVQPYLVCRFWKRTA